MKLRHLHYWVSLLLAVALVPALLSLHLPVKFAWMSLGIAYWLVLAAQSIFVAALLSLVGLPKQDALGPLVQGYRQHPVRVAFHLFFFVILGVAVGWIKALILTVDAIAILELRERGKLRSVRQVLLPSLYLFAGFLLVFAYNDIIASIRFPFACDSAFNAMDRWLLNGGSISGLSHWAVQSFPLPFFRFLEFIYFGMFPQIGAGIILVTLYDGRQRGLEFVGTILMAYYLALGIFYLWPSQGPYYLSGPHFPRFLGTLETYSIQDTLTAHAQAIWNHAPIRRISTDYFIAFPCMHIAQPLIVMWFLRRWKRMLIALSVYNTVLIVAILFLEWHYLVDIIGGVLVAVASIAITRSSALRPRWIRAGAGAPPAREGTLSS
jgi:hypothetical protein